MKQIFTILFFISFFFMNVQKNEKYITYGIRNGVRADVFLLTDTVRESDFGDGNGKYLEAWEKRILSKKVKNEKKMQ